jgi:hypothetical protein
MIRRPFALGAFLAAAAVVASLGTLRASAASSVRLNVVRCPTVYGLPRDQYKIPAVPSSLNAIVTPAAAGRLSFYSNGWLSVLAPRGWHCAGVVAATGALDLDVRPPGVSASPGLSDSRADAVTARVPSPDTGEVGGAVCAFFPHATPRPDSLCPSTPSGETAVRLSGTAVAFEDPPGVVGDGDPSGGPDPANGVAVYARSEAAEATCTLPQAEHATCTNILNDFLARHPL